MALSPRPAPKIQKIRPSRALPATLLATREVYRPIKGSPGVFIGVVEAPDETSALKTAIEEFGIVNIEYQKPLFVRRMPGDDE